MSAGRLAGLAGLHPDRTKGGISARIDRGRLSPSRRRQLRFAQGGSANGRQRRGPRATRFERRRGNYRDRRERKRRRARDRDKKRNDAGLSLFDLRDIPASQPKPIAS